MQTRSQCRRLFKITCQNGFLWPTALPSVKATRFSSLVCLPTLILWCELPQGILYFIPPPNTDKAMLLILEEIAKVGMQIQVREVTIVVTPDGFKYYWQQVNKCTSLLHSGLHFGHYKAAADSDLLSKLHFTSFTSPPLPTLDVIPSIGVGA